MNNICSGGNIKLRQYQLAVSKWMVNHPNQKGLLVEYGTGTGKTLVAASVGEMLYNKKMIDKIIVITPKSLIINFKKAIRLCLGKTIIPKRYAIKTYEEFRRNPVSASDRTLIVIDEAHNLRNSSTGRAKAVLEAAEASKYVVLLTATPFVNAVSDISFLMRMILPRGKDDSQWSKFPLSSQAFMEMYKSNHALYVKNMKNHIAVYRGDDAKSTTKPRVEEHFMEVPLSKKQLNAIEAIRNRELGSARNIEILEYMLTTGTLPPGANFSKLNAFLTKVRQISNALTPELECDPKVMALAKKAVKGPKPVMIYSEFKKYGINNIDRCLKKQGVKDDEIRYFTGNLSTKKRNDIIQDYNSGKVKYLLVTSAGAEGLSLKGTRQIHVTEPYWNMSKPKQVVGRGIRMDSHTYLPLDQQKVDIYYWVSTAKGKDASLAPDVHLLKMANKKQEQINEFERLNERASIPIRPSKLEEEEEEEEEKLEEKRKDELLVLSSSSSSSSDLSSISSSESSILSDLTSSSEEESESSELSELTSSSEEEEEEEEKKHMTPVKEDDDDAFSATEVDIYDVDEAKKAEEEEVKKRKQKELEDYDEDDDKNLMKLYPSLYAALQKSSQKAMQSKIQSQSKPKPKPKPKPKVRTKSKARVKVKAQPKARIKAKARAKSQPKARAKAQPKAQPKAKARAKSQPKEKGKCKGNSPPCPQGCNPVRSYTYTTKSGKQVTRRASCR